jgi:4-amino-4-deoxy-L-arabinose transferase-like glycosyltransferase
VNRVNRWRAFIFSDTGILLILGLLRMIIPIFTSSPFGWHRDELDTLDAARHLTWGYVSYPPFAPFLARIALAIFGPSLLGMRLFPALAHAASMVVTGLMARELGGKR